MFLGLCRCLCGRSDWVAVCIYLLPPALPALSAHGLPPALCQPGCHCPRPPASVRRPATHRQCHHPSFGGLDWRACMTSGQRRDSPNAFAEPPSSPPRSQWLTDFSPDSQKPLPHDHCQIPVFTRAFFCFYHFNFDIFDQSWLIAAKLKSLLSSVGFCYLMSLAKLLVADILPLKNAQKNSN